MEVNGYVLKVIVKDIYLKNCPFCSGTAEMGVRFHKEFAKTFGIICMECNIETNEWDANTPEEAQEIWNKRVKED